MLSFIESPLIEVPLYWVLKRHESLSSMVHYSIEI